MTQNDIDIFLAVVKYGSISAAAKELFIGQPTVSARLKGLEEELEVTLFRRGKGIRAAELSEEGKKFQPYALEWKKLMERTFQAVREESREMLTVVSGHSIAVNVMPEVFCRLDDELKNVSVRMLQYHYHEAFQMVEKGEADVGFVSNLQFSRKLNIYPLYVERLVWIGGAPAGEKQPGLSSSAPAETKKVHPGTLDVRREIYIAWDEKYNQWHNEWLGRLPDMAMETNDIFFMEQMLRQPGAWAIVPVTAAESIRKRTGCVWRCLEEEPAWHTTCIICRKQIRDYPALESILREMRRVVEENGARWLYGRQGKQADRQAAAASLEYQ